MKYFKCLSICLEPAISRGNGGRDFGQSCRHQRLNTRLVGVVFVLVIGLVGLMAEQLQAFQGGGQKFTALRDEIRSLERDISKRFAAIPIGFPVEQKAELEKIEQLKARIVEIRQQLDSSAIESFRADPAGNPQAGSHIFQMAIAALEGRSRERPFDPARSYELITMLGKEGNVSPEMLSFAYQASLALQDFQRAERILTKLKGMGVPINEAVTSQLTKLKTSWERELAKRAQEQAADDLPRVKLETELGEIVVELFEDDTPQTVANFISLVEQKFYDNSAFFDVTPGRIARAGCPIGDGTGDAGYRIANEPTTVDSRRFFAGTLGMHHEGVNTAGSQFFFTYQPRPDSDLKYVAFGRIIEGLETLYKLPRTEPGKGQFSTSDPPQIIRATVLRKRDHAYEPTKLVSLPELALPGGSEPAGSNSVPKTPSSSGIPDVSPADDGGG